LAELFNPAGFILTC